MITSVYGVVLPSGRFYDGTPEGTDDLRLATFWLSTFARHDSGVYPWVPGVSNFVSVWLDSKGEIVWHTSLANNDMHYSPHSPQANLYDSARKDVELTRRSIVD